MPFGTQLSAESSDGPACRTRVIVLGASNVERGISTIVSVARNALAGPIEFVFACGHGRSFGIESSVLGRRLPGIAPCELWPALGAFPALPTVAVLTDVGNDLLYGAPVERISAWVGDCLRRLNDIGARIVIAGLPLESLERLPRWRFMLLSRVLFPMHAARFESVRSDALRLDAALRAQAEQCGAAWIAPPAEWYGFDPIHIRRSVSWAAWEKIFSAAVTDSNARVGAPRSALRQWLYLKRLRPLRRRWWGIEQFRSQPAGALADGSRVWLY